MNPPVGIRREIKRYDGTVHTQTEELVCPCCGHLTRIEFNQDDGKGEFFTMTHCLNSNCAGYYKTRVVTSFFEMYGQMDTDNKSSAR
jgi:hypothetical protein